VLHGTPLAGLPREELESRIAACREFEDRLFKEGEESDRKLVDLCVGVAYQQAARDLRSIMLVTADGSMKSLLDFTLADVRRWQQRSKANVLSWAARKAFFTRAEQLLTGAGVDTVCDLPPEQIQELAEHARGTWKKRPPAPAVATP